ncbi:MAG: PQQ-dependent sugar dehydrogenase, partial [Gaiellaceae bacterium]
STVPGDAGRGLRGRLIVLERGLKLTKIGRFHNPVYVTSPPNDGTRLFVVEKWGRILIVERGKTLAKPFLDLREQVLWDGEAGMLSIAFAPDYAESGLFYVYFIDRRHNTRVVEFQRSRADANRADLSTRRKVLFIARPWHDHNGGMLQFGPDGYLYISLGDGASGAMPVYRDPLRAQRLNTLLGSILRIDPRQRGNRSYRVPESNPFVGQPGRDEIWVYGLRNPWRYWIDPETGALLIADVGEVTIEEVNYAPRGDQAGRNFGWPCFEGTVLRVEFGPDSCGSDHTGVGLTPPIFEYPRDRVTLGTCSVIGGPIVRDPRLPGQFGRYIYSDYCTGQIATFRPVPFESSPEGAPGKAVRGASTGLVVPAHASFGEDALRRVYVAQLHSAASMSWPTGLVYRIDPKLAPPGGAPDEDEQTVPQSFVSLGCGGCHTLAAANSAGTIGPNLDETRPSLELAIERITNGAGGMPAFGEQLSAGEIEDLARFIVESNS